MNLLRPQARKDGKIFRIIPLPKALEDEAHAAVGRMLWEASVKLYAQDPKGTLGLTYILRVLARCFYPKNNERRQARIKNRGKDYETDRVRDQSIAWLVGDLRTSVGAKRAIPEAAALIRRSPKAVKEARKRVAQRLRERRRRHKTF
jgi:hypothetical protein